jgi:hypothetical protein
MAIAPPLKFTEAVESYQDDEQATIAELNQTFDKILDTTAKDYGHAVRPVHAKAHGILQGTLTVASGLPPELAQGMFAKPGEHTVFMRLSTNAGDILPDTISLPRGLALKVLDVDGERLPGAAGRTQNFVMFNGPVFQAKTADKFLGSLKKLAGTTDKMEGVKTAMSSVMRGVSSALETFGIESPTIQSMGGAPNVDPLGETYYSVTPFRYGNYIAKFAVVPVSGDLTSLTKKETDATDRPDAIRQNVEGEMLVTDGVWEVRVQLCRDLEKQPVEDPTVEWKEEDSPFQTVATIHAGRQDSWDAKQVQKVDEEMRFSPWIGLAAHQPLGNINRARKAPYEHSAEYRARFNRCPHPRTEWGRGLKDVVALAQPSPAFAQRGMQVAKTRSDLKKFDVTVRRFDPAKGLASGTDFVLARTRSMQCLLQCRTRLHSPTKSTAATCCRSPSCVAIVSR